MISDFAFMGFSVYMNKCIMDSVCVFPLALIFLFICFVLFWFTYFIVYCYYYYYYHFKSLLAF